LADDLVQPWFFDMKLKKSVIKVTLIGSVKIFIFAINFNSEPLKSFFGVFFYVSSYEAQVLSEFFYVLFSCFVWFFLEGSRLAD